MNKGEKIVASLIGVLLTMCFVIVVLGGYVRLSDSGLAIPEWPFFTVEVVQNADGTETARKALFPPTDEAAWVTLKATFVRDVPRFEGVDMASFKRMFWTEWSHRGVAKGIGLVYLAFLAAVLAVPTARRLMAGKAVFGLVLLVSQAVLGAVVVFTHLMPVKVALHLVVAFLFTSLLLWMLLQLVRPPAPANELKGRNPILGLAIVVYVIAMAQIFSGGLVAGSHAGYMMNTWPKMGDFWVPPNMMDPEWGFLHNMAENKVVIQFTHRWFAFAVVAATLFLVLRAMTIRVSQPARWGLRMMFGIVVFQVALGVITLRTGVHTHVALTHQFVGLLVLLALLFVIYETSTQPVLCEEALAELEEQRLASPTKAEVANA